MRKGTVGDARRPLFSHLCDFLFQLGARLEQDVT